MSKWAIPSVWVSFAVLGLGSILWFESEIIAMTSIVVTGFLAMLTTMAILDPEKLGNKRK